MAKQTITKNPSAPTLNEDKGNHTFLFDKTKYMLMIGGLIIMILGLLLMTGGKSEDPNVFDADALYSTVRITIAPLLILAGLGLEIYAIMRKPKF